MSDYDRKLYNRGWDKCSCCVIDVHGNVEIDKGDLLFLDRVDGLRSKGLSSKDYYAYPLSKVSGSTNTLASNMRLAAENFLGVAAWHSDSGVTEKIAVHIDGLFKYPLKNSRKLKPTYYITATGSGVTLYNQKVSVSSSGVSDAIGFVATSGTFMSEVEMNITTIFFGDWRW